MTHICLLIYTTLPQALTLKGYEAQSVVPFNDAANLILVSTARDGRCE